MGDVRKQRDADDCEAAILTALERPLSYRELWATVADWKPGKRFERALEALMKAGKVAEVGTRRTFDYGTERLLKRTTHNC